MSEERRKYQLVVTLNERRFSREGEEVMSKSKWPSREAIDRIVRKVDENPDLYTTQDLPPNATEKDRLKYAICAEFVKYMNQAKTTQRELAKRLAIDEALVSKLVRYHISEFSLDRLFDFLNALDPSLTLKVQKKNEGEAA